MPAEMEIVLTHSHPRPPTYFDKVLSQCREGLEGVLLVMARDTSHHFHWSLFGILFDSLQLLAYPLYSGPTFPW
jgi:hypothetical protein